MRREVLGEKLKVAGWTLRGVRPVEEMIRILADTVHLMGMDTGGMEPVVKQYPLNDGRGGMGSTLFLPFGEPGIRPGWRVRLALRLLRQTGFASQVFQPLVESFIVSDDYIFPDRPEMNRTCILAASCLPFDAFEVGRFLAVRVGPIIKRGGFEL